MWTIFKVLLNFFNKETELLLFCVLVSWPQGMWYLSFPTRGWTSTTCPGGFRGGTGGQESSCQCRRHKRCDLIPGLGRSPDEGMATHSSILAWSTPWTEEPGRLQSMGSQELGMTEWHACMRAHACARAHTHTHTHRSFPGGSDCKQSCCNAGYMGLNPGLGGSPGGGHGNPFQYSCLENPMDRRGRQLQSMAPKSWTWLCDWIH